MAWLNAISIAETDFFFLGVPFCCRVFLGLSEMYLPKCWLQAVHCTLYIYHSYFSMLCPVRWHWLRQLERPGQSSRKRSASSSALQMGSCARPLVILLWGSISQLLLPFISAHGTHLQKLMWKNTIAIADFHSIFLDQPWVICCPLTALLCVLY